jgi:hypothetical protein
MTDLDFRIHMQTWFFKEFAPEMIPTYNQLIGFPDYDFIEDVVNYTKDAMSVTPWDEARRKELLAIYKRLLKEVRNERETDCVDKATGSRGATKKTSKRKVEA